MANVDTISIIYKRENNEELNLHKNKIQISKK